MARDIFAAIHEIWEAKGFNGIICGGLHNGIVGDPELHVPYATLNWLIETKGVQTNMRSIRNRVIQIDVVDKTPGKVQSYLRQLRTLYDDTYRCDDEEVIGFTIRDVFVFLDQNHLHGAFEMWVGRMQIEFKFLYDWSQTIQQKDESSSSTSLIGSSLSSSSSTTSDEESVLNLFSTSSWSSASSKSSLSGSSKSSLSTTSQSTPSSVSSGSTSSSSSSSTVVISHSSSSSSTSSTVEVRSASSVSSSSSSTVIESRSSSSSSLSSLSVSSSSSSSSSSSG